MTGLVFVCGLACAASPRSSYLCTQCYSHELEALMLLTTQE